MKLPAIIRDQIVIESLTGTKQQINFHRELRCHGYERVVFPVIGVNRSVGRFSFSKYLIRLNRAMAEFENIVLFTRIMNFTE